MQKFKRNDHGLDFENSISGRQNSGHAILSARYIPEHMPVQLISDEAFPHYSGTNTFSPLKLCKI